MIRLRHLLGTATASYFHLANLPFRRSDCTGKRKIEGQLRMDNQGNRAPGSEATILLVDDTPSKLLAYEVMLRGLGAQLVKADSAESGFRALLYTDIALIITDVSMPDIDGFEFAKMVRGHPRFAPTPIIFVSAFAQSELDQLNGYETGAVD
jgi:CheY-like chemotaxis protein